jgi:hypothetical protein
MMNSESAILGRPLSNSLFPVKRQTKDLKCDQLLTRLAPFEQKKNPIIRKKEKEKKRNMT